MKNDRLVVLRVSRSQIGIPTSTYAMIETGRRFPRKKLQGMLASFHGVTVDYLFFNQDEQKSSTNNL